MPGKPTIPARVHARIRSLSARGWSHRDIMGDLGVSRYTVRKALRPDYAEREAERHRSYGPRERGDAYREHRAAHYRANAKAIIARVKRNKRRRA